MRVCAHVGAQLCVTPVAGTVQVCTVAIHAASPGIGYFGSVARSRLRPPSPFSEPSRMPTGCWPARLPGARGGVPICPDTLSHLPGCPSASERSTERDPGPCGRRSGRACDGPEGPQPRPTPLPVPLTGLARVTRAGPQLPGAHRSVRGHVPPGWCPGRRSWVGLTHPTSLSGYQRLPSPHG